VTTATVERTFSSMKLIKTRLRSRMGENTLEHTMRICIEGPDQLSNDTLEAVVASFPGSSPAFCRILYKKCGESLDDLITCLMTYYAWFYAWFW